MSAVLMTGKGQQWLRLGERECTILDAMLEWAKATAKNCPERVRTCDDGHEGLTKYSPRVIPAALRSRGIGFASLGSDTWAAEPGVCVSICWKAG